MDKIIQNSLSETFRIDADSWKDFIAGMRTDTLKVIANNEEKQYQHFV